MSQAPDIETNWYVRAAIHTHCEDYICSKQTVPRLLNNDPSITELHDICLWSRYKYQIKKLCHPALCSDNWHQLNFGFTTPYIGYHYCNPRGTDKWYRIMFNNKLKFCTTTDNYYVLTYCDTERRGPVLLKLWRNTVVLLHHGVRNNMVWLQVMSGSDLNCDSTELHQWHPAFSSITS